MLKTLEAAQNQQQCAGLVTVLAAVFALKVAALGIVSVPQAQVCTAVLDFMDFVAHRLMITAVLFATSEQVLTV